MPIVRVRRGWDGECGRIRTYDPCLKRALLYQLSYAPTLIPIYHIQCGLVHSFIPGQVGTD